MNASTTNTVTKFISFLFLGLFFVACTPVQKIHGNVIDDKKLAILELDKTTQGDVIRTWGTPTTTSTVDNQIWYYIGQKTSQTGLYRPEVEERRVVALEFNAEGILINHSTLTEKDGQEVEVSARETPSTGRKFTIMQQLIGNLGRFNKDNFE